MNVTLPLMVPAMDKTPYIKFARAIETLIQSWCPESSSHANVTASYLAAQSIKASLQANNHLPPSVPPPKCLVLSLPAEIRQRIWRLAVRADADGGSAAIIVPGVWLGESRVEYFWVDNQWTSRPYQPALQPAISRVCRQIRQEVLPLFYHENRFHVMINGFSYQDNEYDSGDWCEGLKWIRDIGPQNGMSLKKVSWLFKDGDCHESYIAKAVPWLISSGVPKDVVDDIREQLTFHQGWCMT